MTKPAAILENLTPEQVANLLADRKILLVDVREPDEYAAQRIQGAVLFPLSSLDTSMLPPDGQRRVVFQCGSGKRSEAAARAHLAGGAPRAAHLAGASPRGLPPACPWCASTPTPANPYRVEE